MSGPALKHWDSHSSIHEAALGEAAELTELYRECLRLKENDKALEVAHITVEHWETRTLQHAKSEEEGLYKEITEKNPEARDTIIALTRDHSLMRHLVEEVKHILAEGEPNEDVLQRFHALILIDVLHNEAEGKLITLLEREQQQEEVEVDIHESTA